MRSGPPAARWFARLFQPPFNSVVRKSPGAKDARPCVLRSGQSAPMCSLIISSMAPQAHQMLTWTHRRRPEGHAPRADAHAKGRQGRTDWARPEQFLKYGAVSDLSRIKE